MKCSGSRCRNEVSGRYRKCLACRQSNAEYMKHRRAERRERMKKLLILAAVAWVLCLVSLARADGGGCIKGCGANKCCVP